MNYNPKLVSFDRSAAYVRHRALKNMRDNHPVDGLELMRQAVEQSPGNREYLLDLAEMYCEMGCHDQSNRILLDMIAQKDAPAECYYGLALNQFGRNELESARQAIALYQSHTRDGAYLEEAGGLVAEMDYYDALRRPADRKAGRAARIAERACDAMKAGENERACRLFRKSFALCEEQTEMRALYAMVLCMMGNGEEAIREAYKSIAGNEPSVRALCVSAQVMRMCGRELEAREMILHASSMRPMGVELRLMIFTMGEIGMHAEAAEAIKRALQETPHDKALLHMRAVALYRSGSPAELVQTFWLRILRIDPEDSVAQYYHDLADGDGLAHAQLEYIYEVPNEEYRRRMLEVADALGNGLESAVGRWAADADFRRLLRWAVSTGEEVSGRAAIMVIASAADDEAESAMREFLYRSDIPISVKVHGMLFLQVRGAELGRILPPGVDLRDGVLPESEQLLKDMPACERQLVRFAGEILEENYGLHVLSALTVMWQCYKQGRACDIDPLVCTQEAAAALAWNYLLNHGVHASVSRLADLFGCRVRRMVFYARRMAAVLEMHGGYQEHEDH